MNCQCATGGRGVVHGEHLQKEMREMNLRPSLHLTSFWMNILPTWCRKKLFAFSNWRLGAVIHMCALCVCYPTAHCARLSCDANMRLS